MIDLDRAAEERLLGRPVENVLTAIDRRALKDRRLLVTGAGGSVGSALALQLAACEPASLTLVDHAEYNLFRIERRLRAAFPKLAIEPVLGDVSRRADIRHACLITRPHAVYHAAAYKHVPITEVTVIAAVRTNVLGTVETIRAARDVGARFLLVSSDKAADPSSVMGATKRLAELVATYQRSRLFRPVVVRFGNILGSSGSVVEIMAEAVRQGRNVPVTDPAATRFFMTADEAVSLVIKADLMGRGGDVFWLEMGPPLRIGELAQRIIEWGTAEGRQPVDIDIIGLRAGEKLREELTTQGLEMRKTSHPRIWSARQKDVPRREIIRAVRQLRRACASGDAMMALETLAGAVAGYEPSDAAIKAARSASRRIGAASSTVTSAVA